MANGQTTVRVRITGRVQGVSFRVWTQDAAHALGLAGWVRNEPDGSVSALIHGDAASVDTMLDRLREGPPGAVVSDVRPESDAGGTVPGDFEIRA